MDADTRLLLSRMDQAGFLATWTHTKGGLFHMQVIRKRGRKFIASVTGPDIATVARFAAEQVGMGAGRS